MKKILLVLVCLGMVGCATSNRERINPQKANINYSDGINEAEAVILAQAFLIEKGLENKINISKPKASKGMIRVKDGTAAVFLVSPEEDEKDAKLRYWSIVFPPNNFVMAIFGIYKTYVGIDASSGKIFDWGIFESSEVKSRMNENTE